TKALKLQRLLKAQVLARKRLYDGTDIAVSILNNADNDNNISTPGIPRSLNPNAEHLHCHTSLQVLNIIQNTNIPTIVIQEKMVIIRILFVEFNDDNDNNISTPVLNIIQNTNIPTIVIQEKMVIIRILFVELDDSQSHSDSNKSQNEKSDSIIFDTPSDRFKALPLSNKVRLLIAYVCNTGSLLIEIAVILYDFIELLLTVMFLIKLFFEFCIAG
ncbi:13023_t:CDS:2, partial [Gigaspora margarita]